MAVGVKNQTEAGRGDAATPSTNKSGAPDSETCPEHSLARLPLVLHTEAVRGLMLPAGPPIEVDPQKQEAALRSVGLTQKSLDNHLQVSDTYGAKADPYLKMAQAVLPKVSLSPEMQAKLAQDACAYQYSAAHPEQGQEPRRQLTDEERVFINKLSEAERDYRRFETTWYSPTVDSDSEYNLGAPVRQQLVAELMKREPEFKVEFTAESELVTAGRVLGNKVSPYQLNSTPASVYEVFGVIRGDGGFQVQDEAPHSYGIQIGVLDPEVALAGKDPLLAQLAKSVIDQKAEGSLGLALVHEEIHSRTGVYRQSENSMPFQTPDLAAEIPTVLYEVLMITDSYHQWKARGDPNYDFRSSPTGIELKTAAGSLNVDFVYSEAKTRFGVLDHNGVSKFLDLLESKEASQFLNRLIWGSARAPEIVE